MTSGQTDSYADELERRKQLAEWKARKKAEKEEAERQQKRAALEAHLAERARTYFDHTGSTPATAVLERWQQEYLDAIALQREAERAERLAQVEAEHYDRLH